MQYDDVARIVTPEGVELEVPLAGLGSRLAAGLIDAGIQVAILASLAVLLLVPFGVGGQITLGVGIFALFAFIVHYGYHVVFETFSSGRSPGKRWCGLRVVRSGGGPLGFRHSAVRNVLRIVDVDLTMGAAGLIAVLASRNNQRLGDMAAGTLVVRERSGSWTPTAEPVASPQPPPWDVSGVTSDELSTIRTFLERRTSLDPRARRQLATEIALRLRPRVVGAPDNLGAEDFLSGIAAAKGSRD